jgi:uncharacterized protein
VANTQIPLLLALTMLLSAYAPCSYADENEELLRLQLGQNDFLLESARIGHESALISGLERESTELLHDIFGTNRRFLQAAIAGNEAALHGIIERGDVNYADSTGATALMYASDGMALLAYGHEGESIRHICERDGEDLSMVRLLLGWGAEVSAADDKGVTALMRAAATGTLGVMDALLAAGADPNSVDVGGRTALHHAVAMRAPESKLVALLDRGVDADVQDAHGESALMLAAGYRDWRAARLLLQRGADPDLQDQVGDTALICAVRSDLMPVFWTLLWHDADVTLANHSGATPLMIAATKQTGIYTSLLLDEIARNAAADSDG